MQDRQRLYEEEADLAARLDDPVMAADASFNLGAACIVNGDLERGRAIGVEARRQFEALGDTRALNRVAWGEANLTPAAGGSSGRPPDARPDPADGRSTSTMRPVCRAGGGQPGLGAVSASATSRQATDWAVKALADNYRHTRPRGLHDRAADRGRRGERGRAACEDAVALMGAFDALCERYGVRPPVPLQVLINEADPLAEASARLDAEEVVVHLRRGKRMTIGEAVELVIEVSAVESPAGVSRRRASGSRRRSSRG